MDDLRKILDIAGAEALSLLPWFALAVVVSGVIQVLSLEEAARRAFTKRGGLSILFTTALGAFSPLCSCTVIPLVSTFLRSGVPLSAVMAFWIASPTMDPELFGLTAAQLGMPIAVARLLGSIGISLAAGFLVLFLERRGRMLDPVRRSRSERKHEQKAPVPAGVTVGGDGERVALPIVDEPAQASTSCCSSAEPIEEPAPVDDGCCGSTPAPTSRDFGWRRWFGLQDIAPRALLRVMADDSLRLGRWLLLAIILQALMVLYLPSEPILTTLGSNSVLAIPLAAAVGIPLYLNGVGALPITAGLLDKGMLPGAAVAFLLAGAITTVPAIAAVRGVVKDHVLAFYLGVGFVGSVIAGLIANLWL